MKINKIVITTAMLAVSLGASAQKQWSLAECIDYALEHNITVRQQQINVAQNEVSLNSSRNSKLPEVSGSVSENLSFGRGLTADNTYANTNTGSTGFSLGADIPVFQGFRIKRQIAKDELNLAASVADLEKAKDDIRVQVAQAYVQILYDNEILAVSRNQVKVDSLQAERLEAMFVNGKTSAAEVSRQHSTLASDRLSETQARNNLSLAILDLSQLLELPSPEGFDVFIPEVSDEQVLLESPESIYAQAVEIKPSIDAEKIRLDYAEVNVDYAKSSYLPSLSLSGGIGTNSYRTDGRSYDSFFNQMKNNFSEYIGLSLSVPIFNRLSTRNSVRSAQLSLQNQQLTLDNAKKSLYKEIQTAYYNAVASQAKLESSRKAAKSSEESFELVRVKYENGKANITEYNESKQEMVQAQSNLAQALFECKYQCMILDFYRTGEIHE